jgi:hypothetical protein
MRRGITGSDYRTPHAISAILNPVSTTFFGDAGRVWLNPEIISDVLYAVTNYETGKILLLILFALPCWSESFTLYPVTGNHIGNNARER